MYAVSTTAPEVTIKPAWSEWANAINHSEPSPARAELGLDTVHPIVFSGHQPIIFHNGILAKFIAQHRAAQLVGASRVWIVADQDPVNPAQIRVPNGIGAALHAETIDLIPPESFPDGCASASIPSQPISGTTNERLRGLASMLSSAQLPTAFEEWNSVEEYRSVAKQFAHSTIVYACERLRVSVPKLIFASELFSSDTLWGIVEQMLTDPHACVEAYNEAAARYPDARVRPLEVSDTRVELPMWGLRSMEARVPITTDNYQEYEREELAPRGLFMSLLVRAHLGDLFIHGTGGWVYDNITQYWARDWLGIDLAPMALVTATQRLDLGFEPDQIIDPARAMWEAHHAKHNPSAVGDLDTQKKKDMCLRRIKEMQQHNEDPSSIYFQMHRVLEEFRTVHADALAGFDERVRVAKKMQKQIEIAADRTWAFPLFDDDALHALKDRIHDAMS